MRRAGLGIALLLLSTLGGCIGVSGTRPVPSARALVDGAAVPAPAAFLDYCARLQNACLGPGESGLDQLLALQAARRERWTLAFAQARAGLSGSATSPTHGLRGPLDAVADAQLPALPDTVESWALLQSVNRSIDRTIRPASDTNLYGRDEWSEAVMLNGRLYGDCEDFVLAKRSALLAAGVDPATLSILIVKTARGAEHAVLLVRLQNRGEYALDSLSPTIVPSWRIPYEPLQRQVDGDPYRWRRVAWGRASSGAQDDV